MANKRISMRPRKRSGAVEPTVVKWEKVIYHLFSRVVQDVGWDGDLQTVQGALRAQDWESVLRLTKADPPQLYADARSYYAACQVEHLFKKLPIPGSDLALREAAWKIFKADEHRNKRNNARFGIHLDRMSRMAEPRFEHKNALYVRLMHRMQRTVASILGEAPDFSELAARCDFGPGSSVGAGGDATHPYAKLDKLSCSDAAFSPFCSAAWEHDQFRALFSPENKEGFKCYDFDVFCEELRRYVSPADYNKIDFVPKNAKAHRITAGEPSGNGWIQQGTGELMAHLLHRARPWLNHRDQTRNQRMAREASVLSNPEPQATIDLKSSSQSFATKMVKVVFQLAPGWFEIMNRTRAANYSVRINPNGPEARGKYELFCSMGNGFCFPLQMVIYSAAIEACHREFGQGKKRYGVFGDDLIVDQRVALLLIEWLHFLGIRTNTDKTFVFGPFRESCGTDYWDGENVRPYVLDKIPSTCRQLVTVANGINYTTPYPLWRAWWGLWEAMPSTARSTVRPHRGPDDTGLTVPVSFYDLHRLDEYDGALQRYKFRQYSSQSIPDDEVYVSKRSPDGQMFLALRGSTPAMKRRIELGREAPVHVRMGTPTPCFRRKTRQLLETL